MDLFLQFLRSGVVITSALAASVTFFGIMLASAEGVHPPAIVAFKRVAVALLFLVLVELCLAGFVALFIQGGS
jgi:hypothetical protein